MSIRRTLGPYCSTCLPLPSTSLSLPCSSLSPVDSHLPNGVGGGMGRGSPAVGGKLQASLFRAPAAVASAPSREGSWSQEGDNQACSRGPSVCREQLSSQGACRPSTCAVPCAAALALLPPKLVLPSGCSPRRGCCPALRPTVPRPLKGPKASSSAVCEAGPAPLQAQPVAVSQAHPQALGGLSPLASSPQPLGAWPAVGQMTTPTARWAGGRLGSAGCVAKEGKTGSEEDGRGCVTETDLRGRAG